MAVDQPREPVAELLVADAETFGRAGAHVRERPRATAPVTVGQLVEMAAARGRQLPVQPLDVLAGRVADGIRAGVYCITADLAADVATLRERAGRLGDGKCPTIADGHGILG